MFGTLGTLVLAMEERQKRGEDRIHILPSNTATLTDL